MGITMSASPHGRPEPDFSERFYQSHAARYAEVAHNFLQSVYIKSSHPSLKSDTDLLKQLRGLVPSGCGLDAGCGAGARDVYDFWQKGYDIHGVDAVAENIREAKALHPEIADRVAVVDLRQPIDFSDASFDFVMCNAVIQHIEPPIVFEVTLPEFARMLKPGGVLQLMFKNGRGVQTVYDRDYGAERSFQLYDEHDVLRTLQSYGLELVEAESPETLGGILYFTDPKPMDHCVFYVRRRG
jgi:SAM-dependent methyltransferase